MVYCRVNLVWFQRCSAGGNRSMANNPVEDAVLSTAVVAVAENLRRRLAPLVSAAEHNEQHVADVHFAMTQGLLALADLNCWGPQNRIPSSHLWKTVGDILGLGRLQRHAREKPHGYAGDFEMLDMICQNERFGTGIAWTFDDFFQRQPAPTAVRNRAEIVAARMAQQLRAAAASRFEIVSLGSGPAFDLTLLGAEISPRSHPFSNCDCRLTLIDLDPRALDFAVGRLSPYFPASALHAERVNLKRVLQNKKVLQRLGRADFLSCPGFFDYLNHEEAVSMLGRLWAVMKPGSELLVFAFSEDNPSRAYMEWIGNWYLIYRSPAQMQQLAQEAGLNSGQYEVDAESSGVNLFIHARKLV